jgi:hypothetical protein
MKLRRLCSGKGDRKYIRPTPLRLKMAVNVSGLRGSATNIAR